MNYFPSLRYAVWPAILLCMALFSGCSVQKHFAPGCDELQVDIKHGRLNGLSPDASMEEVKKQFPCFTGVSEEGGAFNYGGGVFFIDHGFFFYTYNDFIEFRDNFIGKASFPLLGKKLEEIQAEMGKPDAVTEGKHLYSKKFGVLRLTYQDNQVVEYALHAGNLESVKQFCEENY